MTHTSLVHRYAPAPVLSCDKCRDPAPRRIAISEANKPPLMLCPGCYAVFDFDAAEDR